MPIYEYYCRKCRQEFELMRSIAQAGESAPCPSCGSPSERLLSSFASKVDFYVRPSGRGAFRSYAPQEPQGQGAAKRKG